MSHSPAASARNAPHPVSRFALLALTLAHIAIGLLAAFKTPLYQGSDEGWHAAYVEHYALGRPLVNLNLHFLSGDPSAPYWQTHEAAQPPLYYILMGRVAALIPRGDMIAEQVLEGSAPNGMYGNFLPADDGSLGTGHTLAGRLMRLITVLMGACVVPCAYGIALLLLQRRDVALLAAGLAAFNPRFVVLGAQISNDMAVACVASITLLACTWYACHATGTGRRDVALVFLMGAGAGVALLFKYSGAAIVFGCAAALLVRAFAQRWPLGRFMRNAAVCSAGALVACGWFLARNWAMYGDVLAMNRVNTLMPVRETLRPFGEILEWVPFIVSTFFSHPTYALASSRVFTQVMTWVFVFGMGAWLLHSVTRLRTAPRYVAGIMPSLAALAANLAAFIPWLREHDATQNLRFFSPMFASLTAMLAIGIALSVPRRFGRVLTLAAIGVLAVVVPASLWIGYNDMYAFPNHVRGAQARALLDRQWPGRVQFENGIELLDVQQPELRAGPGRPIALTLTWRATRPLTDSAHLMLDVRDAQNQTIAALNTGNELRYSRVSRAWQVGVPVQERYEIALPAARSQVVRVLAGWNSHVHPGMPIRPVGNPSVSVEVARYKLHAPGPVPEVATSVQARYGGLADLLNVQMAGNAVVLRWRATARADRAYSMFIHGVGRDGALVAQADAPFAYTSVFWDAGEVFEERLVFERPPAVTELRIGIYDAADGQRLEAIDAAGQPLADNALVVPVR